MKKNNYNNNNKRMCAVFSFIEHALLMFEGHFIEYVCWWEFVCKLSKTPHSLYSLCRIFWEWVEWPSLRGSRSLSIPSLHSWLMLLHFMFDLSGSLLLFAFFISPSSSFLLLIYPLCFTPCSFITTTHSKSDTFFASSLHISLSVQLSSLLCYCYHIHIKHPQVHGSRVSIHVAFSYMRAWVFFIIRYLGLVFLHFFHPITLAYITSCVLRLP